MTCKSGKSAGHRPHHGCLQVYTGHGKGKTTAALGLALRAAGHGWRVYIAQFMKHTPSGELRALRHVAGITIRQFGTGHFVRGTPSPHERQAAQRGLAAAQRALLRGRYQMVILDEICCAVTCGLIDEETLLALVAARPATVELIVTGRDARPRLLQCADLVSEIRARKHPFTRGLPARRGIEW